MYVILYHFFRYYIIFNSIQAANIQRRFVFAIKKSKYRKIFIKIGRIVQWLSMRSGYYFYGEV
jgi:hypothetical protein